MELRRNNHCYIIFLFLSIIYKTVCSYEHTGNVAAEKDSISYDTPFGRRLDTTNMTMLRHDVERKSVVRCYIDRSKLRNGRIKIRSKGRIAKFVCDPGYVLAGKRFATCVNGQWNNPIPICVSRGCPRFPYVPNGEMTEKYSGAMLMFQCNPGYSLDGSETIYCNGKMWNASKPVCNVATTDPEKACDFENRDLCGWSHDPQNDFDWERNQFMTPTGHVGTGPSYDHTFGVGKGGFYLYLEASSPRTTNDTTRLFSPVYPDSYSGGCFVFWYHMYGATTGGLRVYLKPETHVFGEQLPVWEKWGDQGNQWLRSSIDVPSLNEPFQIIIEGIRGTSYVGDSAIDDVQLTKSSCNNLENETDIVADTDADSCRGRCREPEEKYPCGCSENCIQNQNCCKDYTTVCISGNDTSDENPDEQSPYSEVGSLPPAVLVTVLLENTDTTESHPSSVTIKRNATTPVTTQITSISPETKLQTISSSTSNSERNITALSTKSTTGSLPTTISTRLTTAHTIAVNTKGSSIFPKTISTQMSTLNTTLTTKFIFFNSTTVTPHFTTMSTTTQAARKIKTSTLSQPLTTTLYNTITTSSPAFISNLTPSSSPEIISTINVPKITTLQSSSTSPTSTTPLSSTTVRTSSTRRIYNLRPRTRKTTSPPTTKRYIRSSSSIIPSSTAATTRDLTTRYRVTTPYTSSPSIYNTRSYNSSRIPSTTLLYFSTRRSINTTIQETTRFFTKTTSRTTIYKSTLPGTTKPLKTTKSPISVKVTQEYSLNDASKEASTASKGGFPTVTVISLSVVAFICVAVGLVYYRRKQNSKRQSKLSDDSEMRFLSENEILEYSDASALDRILIK